CPVKARRRFWPNDQTHRGCRSCASAASEARAAPLAALRGDARELRQRPRHQGEFCRSAQQIAASLVAISFEVPRRRSNATTGHRPWTYTCPRRITTKIWCWARPPTSSCGGRGAGQCAWLSPGRSDTPWPFIGPASDSALTPVREGLLMTPPPGYFVGCRARTTRHPRINHEAGRLK